MKSTSAADTAEFRRDNDHFEVIDNDSRNRTDADRKQVKSAVLANGDEIQVGMFGLGAPHHAHHELTPTASHQTQAPHHLGQAHISSTRQVHPRQ